MHNTSDCEDFQITLLPPMYGIEFCLALIGNVFALWMLLLKERKNWHTGVVFSCNLVISDLLYIFTLPLLVVYYYNKKNWTFGTFLCKIERFLFTCNLYVSIFFVMCISVNRCVAILYPFFTRSHVRPRHAKIAGVLIWAIVMALSSPVLKFADTCPGSGKTLCQAYCNYTTDSQSHFHYNLFLAGVGCAIPLLVTFASYCSIISVIYKNCNITPLEKRKVTIMVASVLLLYVVSFVPYHIFQIGFMYIRMHNIYNCGLYRAYQVSKGLATLNMCIHPLLYISLIDSIRLACCGKSTGENSNCDPL